MFGIIVLVCVISIFVSFYSGEIYSKKVFNEEKQVPDSDECLFSFTTYLNFGLFILRRGIHPIEVNLYPKCIIVTKGKFQRTIKSKNISFSKFFGYEYMEMTVPDLENPIQFLIFKKEKDIMQKYIEVRNSYDSEEDIINNFR